MKRLTHYAPSLNIKKVYTRVFLQENNIFIINERSTRKLNKFFEIKAIGKKGMR